MDDNALITAHPELMPELREKLHALRRIEEAERNMDETETVPNDESSNGYKTAGDEPPGIVSPRLPEDTFPGYEIVRELHRGGQGVVYQVIQKSTKRKVAIKVLLQGVYASKSAKKRFGREIELVAQLKHPNIISIFHAARTTQGLHFYVMDYVRGLPIDKYVADTKPPLAEVLKLFIKVCEAARHAHDRGIIHRDLKPSSLIG